MKKLASIILPVIFIACVSLTAMATGNIDMSVFNDTKNFKVETDSIEGSTFVDVANAYSFRVNTGSFSETLFFRPSLVRTAQGNLYFRLVGEYTATDWAFLDTLVLRINNTTYTFSDVDSKRDVLNNGNYYEGLVAVLSDNSIKCLEAIKQHRYEPIKARFRGSEKNVDFELPQKIKDALVELYDLYCAAGGLNQVLLSNRNNVFIISMEPTIEDKENIYISVYNYKYYKTNNPDLAALYGDDREAYLNHFITVGMIEGRQGCKEFNLDVYKANNPDLVASFGSDNMKYYEHFMLSGRAEGRKAT